MSLPSDERQPPGSAYGAPFWLAYIANSLLMAAISLLFRYADLVRYLGGSELLLGLVVGVGMLGSLAMRLAQGMGIDRYGPRRMWLLSVVLFIATCLAHLWVTTANGPYLFVLRILFNTALAGAFGASITYISSRAPVIRVAEVIGTLGTSGFVGMVSGTLLGDFLFDGGPLVREQLNMMFVCAAALGLASLGFAKLATEEHTRTPLRRQPPMAALLRRYNPGTILLCGVATGLGVGMPTIFLRTFAQELHIGTMSYFFAVYAPVAFITRLVIRGLPARVGIRPMILAGLGCLAASMLCYLVVYDQWHLMLPALFAGLAHAFLFPSVVGGGSTQFPERYRGLGVTLMLATCDIGNLIGSPLIGAILVMSRSWSLPAYPTMFVTLAVLLLAVAGVYAVTDRATRPWQVKARRPRGKLTAPPAPPPPLEADAEVEVCGRKFG